MSKLNRVTTLIVIYLGLAGCAVKNTTENFPGQWQPTAVRSVSDHLRAAESAFAKTNQASSPEREEFQLIAAKEWSLAGMQSQAQELFHSIHTASLTPSQRTSWRLLASRLMLQNGHPQRAYYRLPSSQEIQHASAEQRVDFYELNALIYSRLNQSMKSVQYRLALEHLLTNVNEIHNNKLQLWETLLKIPNETLDAARAASQDQPELRAWVELAYITTTYGHRPKELIKQIDRWHDRYPEHAANRLLPDLENGTLQLEQPAQHIALLLPLQGELKSSGQAIHDGFFAGYYRHRWQTNPKQVIRVYNTAGDVDVKHLYEQTIADGSDLVVGPLTKNNVKQIKHASHPVTTLALNNLGSDDDGADNFYQFGLSPQVEAQQVADKAWQSGHRRVIMITPAGHWGQNIAEMFKQRWQSLGGQVVDSLAFTPGDALGEDIQNLLQVKTEYLVHHAKIKKKLPPNERRRQDMDMFFVVANPMSARQILPLLRFYFAGAVPVYSTSLMYTGVPNPRADRDLNGVYFCDMPWLVEGKTNDYSQRRIARLWPNSYDHTVRLYALGMDAYLLASQIDRLKLLPQIALPGKTGNLYLVSNGHIYRKLSWARFRQGQPSATTHTG